MGTSRQPPPPLAPVPLLPRDLFSPLRPRRRSEDSLPVSSRLPTPTLTVSSTLRSSVLLSRRRVPLPLLSRPSSVPSRRRLVARSRKTSSLTTSWMVPEPLASKAFPRLKLKHLLRASTSQRLPPRISL